MLPSKTADSRGMPNHQGSQPHSETSKNKTVKYETGQRAKRDKINCGRKDPLKTLTWQSWSYFFPHERCIIYEAYFSEMGVSLAKLGLFLKHRIK